MIGTNVQSDLNVEAEQELPVQTDSEAHSDNKIIQEAEQMNPQTEILPNANQVQFVQPVGGMGMGNYYLNQNQSKFQGKYFPQTGGSYYYQNPKQTGYPQNFNQNQQHFSQKASQIEDLNMLKSLKYVQDIYPQFINVNANNIGYTEKVKYQTSPRFFVIKSFTEEDIHKSIKYSCWSSTKEGNRKLSATYEECQKNNSDVFLFFSMNGSGRFVGVAKMNGKVDEEQIFEYWAMDEVWRGLMEVEWVFIKDVPNKILKEIKLSNNSYKPVTNSRDTQEIPLNEGITMMAIFEEFRYQTSILQHFQYYDERQELFEKARNSSQYSNSVISQQKQFSKKEKNLI